MITAFKHRPLKKNPQPFFVPCGPPKCVRLPPVEGRTDVYDFESILAGPEKLVLASRDFDL